MISFELDVANRKMIVHGDDTMHRVDGYNLSCDPTIWCINYLRNYMYRSVSQLVSSRRNVFLHIEDNDSVQACDGLHQKVEYAYNSTDWIKQYLDLLFSGFDKIKPNYNSRYFANFHSKRIELIELLKGLSVNKPLFYRTNIAKQMRLI